MKRSQSFIQRFSIVAVLLTAMIFSACPRKTEDDKPNLRQGAVTVLGDKTKCAFNGQPTVGNPLVGTWDALNWQENDLMRFTYGLVIEPVENSTSNFSIQFVNFCTHKKSNRSSVATVTTALTDKVLFFEIEKSLTSENKETFPEFEITCDAESIAGKYQYSFDGNCLVVDGGYFLKRK